MSTTLIAQYYAAFNRADAEGMLALLSETVAHDINQGASEHGVAAFRRFLAHMDACYREQVRDLIVLGEPSGQRFAAEFVVTGTYLNTDPGLPEAHGQTYTLPAGAFFEVRDGQITRVSNYYNLRHWLAQIGA